MAVQNFGSGGGFQTSPGINISEIDLTTTTPAVDTTVGAFAGVFRWGPVGVRTLVSSENDLVAKFGKPTSINPETFFTAANFLSYSNALYISRAANSSLTTSAIATSSNAANLVATASLYTILNENDFETKQAAINSSVVSYIARWPGELGNSLKVSVCDSASQFSTNVYVVDTNFITANTKFSLTVGSTSGVLNLYNPSMTNFIGNTPLNAATTVANKFSIGDFIVVGDNTIGTQALKILSKTVDVISNNSINTVIIPL